MSKWTSLTLFPLGGAPGAPLSKKNEYLFVGMSNSFEVFLLFLKFNEKHFGEKNCVKSLSHDTLMTSSVTWPKYWNLEKCFIHRQTIHRWKADDKPNKMRPKSTSYLNSFNSYGCFSDYTWRTNLISWHSKTADVTKIWRHILYIFTSVITTCYSLK